MKKPTVNQWITVPALCYYKYTYGSRRQYRVRRSEKPIFNSATGYEEHNWHLEAIKTWSTSGPQRCKLSVRPCKLPKRRNAHRSKTKTFARRSARRSARQYIAANWQNEDMDRSALRGLDNWHFY